MNNKVSIYKKITSKLVFTLVSISMIVISIGYSYNSRGNKDSEDIVNSDNDSHQNQVDEEVVTSEKEKLNLPPLDYLKKTFNPYTDIVSEKEFMKLFTNYISNNNVGDYSIDYLFTEEGIINVEILEINSNYYETHSYKYFV